MTSGTEFTTDTGLPRIRFDCGTRSTADAIREQYPDAITDEDDARTASVVITGDAPAYLIDEIERHAYEGREEVEDGPGQTPLSASERTRLDFTRTNVFHARACKAIAIRQGCRDWLAHYDHTLTVDEHRDVYRNATADASRKTLREYAHEKHTPFRNAPVRV